MAHELTHILADHVLYKRRLGCSRLRRASWRKRRSVLGSFCSFPLQLALLKWDRCSELTADRGMLLRHRTRC